MSKLLVSTAFAGLLLSGGASLAASQNVPVPVSPALIPAAMLGNAFQQPNNNQQNNNNQNNNAQRGQNNGGDRGGDRGNGGGDRGNGGDHGAAQQNNQNNNIQRSQNDRGNDNRGNNGDNRGGDHRQGQNFRPGAGPQNAMRGPQGRSGRDFSSYHRNFNAPHRFRGPSYRRPSGWYAHHWVFGETLPSLFWTSSYWLDDFSDFGLMPPPPGTVWVRDGSDALLIDRYDGQIIQVAYDVFY